MVIAMGIEHSNQAAKAQHEVSELTNALLKKNAQQLHQASVVTAKESERGIVDIDTLKQTNQELINTLDEVIAIQKEGHEKRHLIEIPDPNYVIMATAARHAEGSPPALGRVAGLQDAAQRILSAMRQNDSVATDADYQDWEVPGYLEVI
jgi:hypothetical protein